MVAFRKNILEIIQDIALSALMCVGFRLSSVENVEEELTAPKNVKLKTGPAKEKDSVMSTGVAIANTSMAKKISTGK